MEKCRKMVKSTSAKKQIFYLKFIFLDYLKKIKKIKLFCFSGKLVGLLHIYPDIFIDQANGGFGLSVRHSTVYVCLSDYYGHTPLPIS